MKKVLALLFIVAFTAACGSAAPSTSDENAQATQTAQASTAPSQPTPFPSPPPGMAHVPAGEFTMGGEDGDDDERPVHTVHLDAFYIDKTEVTNAAYRQCVEATVCEAPSNTEYYGDADYDQHPVVYVRWDDADAYCRWVGKRLPTEAEWEKAARGIGWWPPAAGLNICDVSCPYTWRDIAVDDGYAGTAPVGTFANASPYGALDMAGNVWEWVADWYDPGYYSQSPPRNPQGPDSGEMRVIRGGSWGGTLWEARHTYRNASAPFNPDVHLGFRCASD